KLAEADKTIISRVEELTNKKEVKMRQIALAWVGQKVVRHIVTISSIELTLKKVAYREEPRVPLPWRYHWSLSSDMFQKLFVV
ncbi:hypothetical protein BU15DRAFT_48386, partial [Melanogaster broomeanus]